MNLYRHRYVTHHTTHTLISHTSHNTYFYMSHITQHILWYVTQHTTHTLICHTDGLHVHHFSHIFGYGLHAAREASSVGLQLPLSVPLASHPTVTHGNVCVASPPKFVLHAVGCALHQILAAQVNIDRGVWMYFNIRVSVCATVRWCGSVSKY